FSQDQQARRVLILFSDMVQESRELNIRQLALKGEDGADGLLTDLAARGRIPRLDNVSVVVVGAGETSAGADSAAFFRAVRTFWKGFFSQAGARLDEAHYGYRTQATIAALLKAP
ncbi:MAG: hypothetical protein ABL967_20730, partial [Bryobacteraceae bacterium]